MSIEHSVDISRSAKHIFAIYEDVNSWAQWDPDVEAVGIDGPFVPGTKGWLKPVGAPRTKTTMMHVQPPTAFTVEAKLPLCTLRFEHELDARDEVTVATHRVLFSGPLAPVFSRLIGNKIRKGIGGTMQGLKEYAESIPEIAGESKVPAHDTQA